MNSKLKKEEIQLNNEQIKATTHSQEPLLIIAGAGTGKTTVITERIKYLIEKSLAKPSEILALTFTERAAQEMEERVDKVLPMGYTQTWISTFHSFCERILRNEAIQIGLSPDFQILSAAESYLFVKKHLFEFDLKYFKPLGNPTKFIGGLVTHFNRLKDEAISPNEYVRWAKPQISNLKSQNHNSNVKIKEETEKYQELARAYQKYEELKVRENVMDFADLISNTLKLFRKRPNVLRKYQEQFKYILIDEFQDTNYAQNHLAIMLAGDDRSITVVADDDQCLPPFTKIKTPTGEKLIKDIRKGDEVISAVGRGYTGISRIRKVIKNKRKAKLLTITTKGGHRVTLTDNHKLFVYTPQKIYGVKDHYYVYLMHRRGLGWRIGVTNDLVTRMRLERSSDKILGIKTCRSEQEARYFETLYSLRYQLPTTCFQPRKGIAIRDKWLEKLHQAIDTEQSALRLAKDLNFDLTKHHASLGGVYRGNQKRVKIVMRMCVRRNRTNWVRGRSLENPKIRHSVHLETSDPITIQRLRAARLKLNKAKRGWVFRKVGQNLEEIGQLAKKIQTVTGGLLEVKTPVGKRNGIARNALVIPAKNLVEGLYLPVLKRHQLLYDQVTKIERREAVATLYDLEIENTHNFIADNIAVHNSIYRWRGAAVYNVLDFKKHFPQTKIITLTKNYRSQQEILDQSYQLIQNNNPHRLEVKEQIDKKLKSQVSRSSQTKTIQVIFEDRVEDEAEVVAKEITKLISADSKSEIRNPKHTQNSQSYIQSTLHPLPSTLQYKDIAILVRANNHAQSFIQALNRHGIPHQFLGPGKLYHKPEIKDLIAYLKILTNFEDDVATYRVLVMQQLGVNRRDVAALLTLAKRFNLSLFETIENLLNGQIVKWLEKDNNNVAMQQFNHAKVNKETQHKLKKLIKIVHHHLDLLPNESPGQILYYFVKDIGLLRRLADPKSELEQRQALNISKFFDKIKAFETHKADARIKDWVEYLDFVMSAGESPLASEIDWTEENAVNIITLHSAKGLEFPIVFMVNLVNDRFPTRNRRDQIPVPDALIHEPLPKGDIHEQEERRLFYVGITRAKEKLYLTGAKFYGEGKRPKKLSPFIYEALGEDLSNYILKDEEKTQPALFEWAGVEKEGGEWRVEGGNESKGWKIEAGKSTLKSQLSTQPSTLNPPISYLSYSQINTFDICPLHYKLKYILNVPTLPSAAVSFGRTLHKTLKQFYQNLKTEDRRLKTEFENGRLKTEGLLNELLTLYNKSWISEGYESKKHEAERKEQGEKYLREFFENSFNPKVKILRLEEPFTFKIRDLKVGGRIDRINQLDDGSIELLDYKTGQVPNERFLKKDLQLSIYALAASSIPTSWQRELEKIKLSYYYFEGGEKKTLERTPQELEETKEKIQAIRKQIQESNFTCSGNLICQKGCEYALFCNTEHEHFLTFG